MGRKKKPTAKAIAAAAAAATAATKQSVKKKNAASEKTAASTSRRGRKPNRKTNPVEAFPRGKSKKKCLHEEEAEVAAALRAMEEDEELDEADDDYDVEEEEDEDEDEVIFLGGGAKSKSPGGKGSAIKGSSSTFPGAATMSKTKRKEKLRTEEFCRAFDKLKRAIPIHPKDQSALKLSRLEILRRTTKYIVFLQDLINYLDSDEGLVDRERKRLREEEQEEQRRLALLSEAPPAAYLTPEPEHLPHLPLQHHLPQLHHLHQELPAEPTLLLHDQDQEQQLVQVEDEDGGRHQLLVPVVPVHHQLPVAEEEREQGQQVVGEVVEVRQDDNEPALIYITLA